MPSPQRTTVLLLALAVLVLVALPAAASDQAPAPAQPAAAQVAQPPGCTHEGPAAPTAALGAAFDAAQVPACSTQAPSAAATGPSLGPIEEARPPREGFCVCGCGITCQTDADCGPGGNCVLFVSCC